MTEKNNEYKIPEGLVFSFPVTVKDGIYKIVPGIAMPDPFSRERIKVTTNELLEERESVKAMLN
jgi:malate dehydrogenase